MIKECLIVLALCILIQSVSSSSESDSHSRSISSDSKSDKINEFLGKSLQHVRGHMTTGIPEWHIPQLEPYYVASYETTLTNDYGPFSIKTTDCKFKGFDTFILRKAELEPTLDRDRFTFEFVISVPRFSLSGNYQIKGIGVSNDKIHGDGPFEALIDECKFSGKGRLQYIDGEGWSVPHIKTKVRINRLDGTLHNFNDRESVNKVFTLHSELRHLYPRLEARVSNVFKEYAEILLKNIKPVELERKISMGNNFFVQKWTQI